MKKPNFFIIGAPKCGTTSLASWLSEHPQIYMSPVKEPHHYSTDFKYDGYNDRDRYLSLFDGASNKHLAVGEASVWYLFSENAVPSIEDELDNPKYIVLLRNPVAMAPSLHEQVVFSGDENIKSFERAWHLQQDRKKGKRVSQYCREPKFLVYGEACRLGSQLERLFNNVPKTRILPIFLEDIKANPRRVWLNVLSFLNVSDDGRVEFPVKNKAKERRSHVLAKINLTYSRVIRKLDIQPLGAGLLTLLNRYNIKEKPRVEVSAQMKAELVGYFKDDIGLLGELLARDLNHWLV